MSVNCSEQSSNQPIFDKTGACWIWPAGYDGIVNLYMNFRQEFQVDRVDQNACLYISTDTDYAAWINGEFAGCGQYHDFPSDKTYDSIPVHKFLRQGTNTISVLAYHQGANSFQYLPGEPGLIYAVAGDEVYAASGTSTWCRKSNSYHSGPVPMITPQLGFTFEYDNSREDNWLEDSYQPGQDWKQLGQEEVKPASYRAVERPRPIKKLDILDRVPSRVVAQGVFYRKQAEGMTVAEQMQTDFLSWVLAEQVFPGQPRPAFPSEAGISIANDNIPADGGIYLVVDLGREEAGFFELDIDVPEQTTLDVAWGEHLDDLRVRAAVGGRNFAARITCRPGRQTITHYFRRMAGRYLQLHILSPAAGIKIHYAGLKPTEYPLQVPGEYCSENALQQKIFGIAVRTLHLCMHEHYEDCPWREQALYGMDSRNQALTGYYCFGEYDFPRASFKLLGDSLQEDGYLELCAPMHAEITIPSFSMAWILEIGEHYKHSGDLKATEAAYPNARKMLKGFVASMENGVLPCPKGERFWQFYDWADGLDGTTPTSEGWKTVRGTQLDSTLNGFYALALISAISLAKACGADEDAAGYQSALETLRANFHDTFYDKGQGAYLTSIGDGIAPHFAELPQALAILTDLAPAHVKDDLRKRLASENNGMIETTLSQSLYKFEALLQNPDNYAGWVFAKVEKDWSYMLQSGATSFWETIKGGDDFGNAGSLCHGWSGTPVYLYMAYILGIKPLSPGFETFKFEPVTGVVDKASGKIPTPYGCIEVSWNKAESGIQHQLDYPAEIEHLR